MYVGRILSSCAVIAAVAGATTVAIGMSRAASTPDSSASTFSMPVLSAAPDPTTAAWTPYRPATPTSASDRPAAHAAARPSLATATHTHPAVTASASMALRPAPRPAVKPAPKPAAKPAGKAAAKPAVVRGGALPVAGSTGTATRVVTVTARSHASTTALVQAWVRAPGGGWLKHGLAIPAHVGADGLSTSASESRSATPIGSFTLTQAFGAYANPGTALPYFRTNSADWWISQAGSLYNTHQHCGSGCGFTHGAPNEHLAYELPFYRYAVVIDYNTRNAPGGVHQGRGSAFFFHVTDGHATAGCVAIAQARLIAFMRWLTPSAHPRMLIGVA